MSTLTIPAHDHGKIRIFSVSGPIVSDLKKDLASGLTAALGTDALNTSFIDLVDIAALNEMTLIDLLAQGYDMTPDAVDEAALTALSDHALLVMSRASGGAETTLTPGPGVTHITTCGDNARLTVTPTIQTEAARGAPLATGKAPRSEAAMAGRVAMVALLVMFALVGLMIWVAS